MTKSPQWVRHLKGLWKMEHVAPGHVGPEQLLQEEVCEDVAVVVFVVLEPEGSGSREVSHTWDRGVTLATISSHLNRAVATIIKDRML